MESRVLSRKVGVYRQLKNLPKGENARLNSLPHEGKGDRLRWMRCCKMNHLHNPKLTNSAQKLRRNMTKEEKRLWYDFLKGLPVTVYRQKVIENYIVDFAIPARKLVIEVDGSQHFEIEGEGKDKARDQRLCDLGYRVLRVSNLDIHRRFKDVCAEIERYIV